MTGIPTSAGLEAGAVEALARAFDREDAAQRGEPDPWRDGADDAEWVSERLACAQVAVDAYRSALIPPSRAVEEVAQFSLRQVGEIDFDGIEGHERINGVVLEGDVAAIRSVAALIGEKVCVVPATALTALSAKLAEVERERDEIQGVFDIRWEADRRAIKEWQEITGRETVWPDHVDLVCFLAMALEMEAKNTTDLRRKLEETRKALAEARDHINRYADTAVEHDLIARIDALTGGAEQ